MPRIGSKNTDRPLTVMVKPELDAILRTRATANHRSVTGEIVFLIETALGCTSESVRETMHLLYKMGAEVTSEATDQPG